MEKSLHHSCASPIKWQGVSLPLDRQSYSRRLLRFNICSSFTSYRSLCLTALGRYQIQYVISLILQNPVFLINSRYSHFSATRRSLGSKSLHFRGHTFSRSYGVKLPSSLTKIHPIVLGYSPHSPESVYGTGSFLNYRSFSWRHGFSHFRANWLSHSRLSVKCNGFTNRTTYTLTPESNNRLR